MPNILYTVKIRRYQQLVVETALPFGTALPAAQSTPGDWESALNICQC